VRSQFIASLLHPLIDARNPKAYDAVMPKPVILILSGLAFFLVVLGVCYYILIPVLNLSLFKNNPDAQRSLNPIVWVVIIGASAISTASFMRLLYDVLYGRRRRQ
jgi:ABC-type Na+ efflux pump permease subunit